VKGVTKNADESLGRQLREERASALSEEQFAEPDEERSEEAIAHPAILDEGLRLNRAFARISDAELRKTIVIFVAGLTKSECAD
jgi:hypothetical protein